MESSAIMNDTLPPGSLPTDKKTEEPKISSSLYSVSFLIECSYFPSPLDPQYSLRRNQKIVDPDSDGIVDGTDDGRGRRDITRLSMREMASSMDFGFKYSNACI